MPEQTVNKIEVRSVSPGAVLQRCKCLMLLFLWRSWHLHESWFIQPFMEVRRRGSYRLNLNFCLSLTHRQTNTHTRQLSLPRWLTRSEFHLVTDCLPLTPSTAPRLQQVFSLSHSDHHIVWFTTSLFTHWFIRFLLRLFVSCLYSLIPVVVKRNNHRLVAAWQYLSFNQILTFSSHAWSSSPACYVGIGFI